MRKMFGVFFVLALLSLSGCAALIPPPWHNSELVIEKDANGEVVRSFYKRTSFGSSYSGDKESANSYASADKRARLGSQKVISVDNGSGGLIPSLMPNPEDEIYLRGKIINRTGSNTTVSFYKDGERLANTYSLSPGREEDVVLPSFGEWSVIYVTGSEKNQYNLLLERGKKTIIDGQPVGWFVRIVH